MGQSFKSDYGQDPIFQEVLHGPLGLASIEDVVDVLKCVVVKLPVGLQPIVAFLGIERQYTYIL